MRVKPTALVGVAIWALYAAIVVGIQILSGVPYDEFGDSTANMWRSVIPSLGIGAIVIAGLAIWLGWGRAALRDTHRTRVGWALIAPAIYVVIVVATFAATDWASITAGYVFVALLLGILVGFAEEFLCRGILLVGLRGSMGEVAVWALTCVLFGLMHGLNVFQGQAVAPTVQQIIVAAVQGSAFYVLRRYFGTLLVAMVLHGFWDMSIFVQQASGSEASLFSALTWVALPFAIAGGYVTAKRTQKGRLEPYAAGATPAA